MSCKLYAEIKTIEVKAKKAFLIDKDYIASLDLYHDILELTEKDLQYTLDHIKDQRYIRIASGNYIITFANISQALTGIIFDKIDSDRIQYDWSVDLLRHGINTLRYSQKAFDANPEHDKYRSGAITIRKNIESLLLRNKKNWMKYLIELDNNQELVKIMKSIDLENYNNIKAKTDPEISGLKKLYFTGVFWLIVLFLIFWIFYSIFSSTIPLLLKPIAGLLIIVAFTVIGAFILRSTNELSEVGFLKLMRLSLRIGFKGIKSIGKKDK